MSFLRPTNGFKQMSEAMLIARATAIHLDVSTHTADFATPTPTMPALLNAINEFSAAVAAVSTGGNRIQIEQKNNLKQALVDMLHNLGYYVMFVSQGDRAIAVKSGISFAKQPTPVVLVKPTDLQLKAGEVTGWLKVSVKWQKGAGNYLYQYTTDAELKEGSWKTHSCSRSKCTLKGLTPGLLYFVRVTIVGANDQQLPSDVSSRIVA